jgi:citrate synthase
MPKTPENPESLYLSAKEAAAELGVSLATLYAYVSRDMIRSEPVPDSRAKRYRAEDVRGLKERRAGQAAATPQPGGGAMVMNFGGAPVLDSAITLIADGKLHYRGSDATALARNSNLEQVAALIWGCRDVQPFTRDTVPAMTPLLEALNGKLSDLPRIERCLSLLPVAALSDPGVYNMTDRGLAATGARLLRFVAAVISGVAPSAEPVRARGRRFMPRCRRASAPPKGRATAASPTGSRVSSPTWRIARTSKTRCWRGSATAIRCRASGIRFIRTATRAPERCSR